MRDDIFNYIKNGNIMNVDEECENENDNKEGEEDDYRLDYAFLRKYTPYMIDVNDNGYYLFNRDYQIIDITEKKYSIENWKGNRIYLYNDSSNPIRYCHTCKKLFKDMILKYNTITSNKTCMNMNEKTRMILNLYK